MNFARYVSKPRRKPSQKDHGYPTWKRNKLTLTRDGQPKTDPRKLKNIPGTIARAAKPICASICWHRWARNTLNLKYKANNETKHNVWKLRYKPVLPHNETKCWQQMDCGKPNRTKLKNKTKMQTQTWRAPYRNTRSGEKIKNAAVFGKLNLLSSCLKAEAGHWIYWRNKRAFCVQVRSVVVVFYRRKTLRCMWGQHQEAAHIVPSNQWERAVGITHPFVRASDLHP